MTIVSEEMAMTTREGPSYPVAAQPAIARAEALDWQSIGQGLDEQGSAMLPGVLSPQECRALAGLYPEDDLFRSRVVMGRHGFGRGEYKYSNYPLPDIIQGLRTALYRRLAPVANQWNIAMGMAVRYPCEHADYLQRCHDAGQLRPTPLLLQYGEGDQLPSQDLYGETFCPYRWPCCFLRLKGTSPAANSCSLNSVRGCNRGRRWYRYGKVMA